MSYCSGIDYVRYYDNHNIWNDNMGKISYDGAMMMILRKVTAWCVIMIAVVLKTGADVEGQCLHIPHLDCADVHGHQQTLASPAQWNPLYLPQLGLFHPVLSVK